MHPFQESNLRPGTCAICKREEIDHTDRATCEVCSNSGPMELIDKILMCADCETMQTPAKTAEELHNKAEITRKRFEELDSQIKIQTDIFNAKTIAIHDLVKAVDGDNSLPTDKKAFIIASTLDARYQKLKELIFGVNQQKSEYESEQKAIQTFFNEHQKKLRADEREKLRLKDSSYQPIKPEIKKPRAAAGTKSISITDLRAAADEHKIPATALKMIMIANNFKSVTDAVRMYKETMSEVQK